MDAAVYPVVVESAEDTVGNAVAKLVSEDAVDAVDDAMSADVGGAKGGGARRDMGDVVAEKAKASGHSTVHGAAEQGGNMQDPPHPMDPRGKATDNRGPPRRHSVEDPRFDSATYKAEKQRAAIDPAAGPSSATAHDDLPDVVNIANNPMHLSKTDDSTAGIQSHQI